jgi:hypothetical protein
MTYAFDGFPVNFVMTTVLKHMRYLLILASFILTCAVSQAQRWKSYQLSVNGDTINTVDATDLKQGRWVVHVNELRGEPGYEEEGVYVDDKKEGPWRRYNLSGDILALENYKWGFRDGKQQYFSMYGDLLREEGWRAVNPKNPYDTIEVPDLNNPMVMQTKIVKHEVSELKHGTWKIFDPSTGSVLKTEFWFYGEKDKSMLGTGATASDTKPVSGDKPAGGAKPKAVEDWEKKNSGKKKVVVRDGRTG